MMGVVTAKRDGLLTLLLLAAICCLAVGYYLWGDWQRKTMAAPRPLPTLPDVQVPADTDLSRMDTLRRRLNVLAYPRAAGHTGTPLALFGARGVPV